MRVGVIGGAGYTAGELLRLLVNHPAAEIAFVHSDSNAGNALGDVHGGLLGETDLRFTAEYDLGAIDVLFLCSAHGRSREFLAANALPEGLRIIDLAQDFRDESEGFVYGLPELNRDRIRAARRVANPGCFATAIQLALLPLAMRGDFARGILASVYTDCDLRQEEAEALYRDFYADAAFTFVADRPIDLKQAVNTNKAVVQVAKYGRKLHIVSAIDNLLKGASGQAVQNMNLLFGLDEREGLRLKASAF